MSPRHIACQTSFRTFMWVFPNSLQQLKSSMRLPATREIKQGIFRKSKVTNSLQLHNHFSQPFSMAGKQTWGYSGTQESVHTVWGPESTDIADISGSVLEGQGVSVINVSAWGLFDDVPIVMIKHNLNCVSKGQCLSLIGTWSPFPPKNNEFLVLGASQIWTSLNSVTGLSEITVSRKQVWFLGVEKINVSCLSSFLSICKQNNQRPENTTYYCLKWTEKVPSTKWKTRFLDKDYRLLESPLFLDIIGLFNLRLSCGS